MKTVTLRIPQPFNLGPQYDPETGELIQSSWPSGIPHEGIIGWMQLGKANGGLSLCEFLVWDDWPIGDIPAGWRANASYIWDMHSQHEYDEQGDLVTNGLTEEIATNQSEYTGHIPPPTDENGDPTGEPTTYHRIHKYQGWPDIDPVEVINT